jgi:hypothetical protein
MESSEQKCHSASSAKILIKQADLSLAAHAVSHKTRRRVISLIAFLLGDV